MKMKLTSFGHISVEGEHYDHDVVIENGSVRKRLKKPSKIFRERFGHTPLSAQEDIPWHGKKLFIGTGTYGSLPIMPEVYEEAKKKGVKVVAMPTVEVCKLVQDYRTKEINAVLHVTC
jgi:hypothetical protein